MICIMSATAQVFLRKMTIIWLPSPVKLLLISQTIISQTMTFQELKGLLSPLPMLSTSKLLSLLS